MTRTVIIDGDILVFRAAEAACNSIETELEEDEHFLYRITSFADKQAAEKAIEKMISDIGRKTKSDEVVICLSDKDNFRKHMNPSYKGNRKKKMKPVLFEYLRNYFMASGYKVFTRPYLEADDVMGILATSEKIIKGDKCIWSYDKDFRTIPCKFAKGSPDGMLSKKIITDEMADYNFMYQTLKGDPVDGYFGVRGIGDKLAKKLLGNVGEKTLKEMWQEVLRAYIEHGQTEEEALMNARMARILRNTDYNFKEKKVILWQPPK